MYDYYILGEWIVYPLLYTGGMYSIPVTTCVCRRLKWLKVFTFLGITLFWLPRGTGPDKVHKRPKRWEQLWILQTSCFVHENEITEIEQISLLAVSISHIKIEYWIKWLGITEFQLRKPPYPCPLALGGCAIWHSSNFGRVCNMTQF